MKCLLFAELPTEISQIISVFHNSQKAYEIAEQAQKHFRPVVSRMCKQLRRKTYFIKLYLNSEDPAQKTAVLNMGRLYCRTPFTSFKDRWFITTHATDLETKYIKWSQSN